MAIRPWAFRQEEAITTPKQIAVIRVLIPANAVQGFSECGIVLCSRTTYTFVFNFVVMRIFSVCLHVHVRTCASDLHP